VRALAECVAWCVLGLALMFFGFATNSLAWGQIFFWGGMAVGYAGMATSLAAAYRRGEERGDW